MKKKPETELVLESWQKMYLEKRDQKYLAEIYKELFPYARSLLLKFIKNKIYLPPETITDTTKDICLLILDKYRHKPDFKIEISFAGYIKYKIMEVLYNPQKVWEEQCTSLNMLLYPERKGQTSRQTELSELSKTLKFEYLFPSPTVDPEENAVQKDTSIIPALLKKLSELVVFEGVELLKVRRIVFVGLALCLRLRRDNIALGRWQQNNWTSDGLFSEMYEYTLLEFYKLLSG